LRLDPGEQLAAETFTPVMKMPLGRQVLAAGMRAVAQRREHRRGL
jgi:hypothetical protein